MAALTQSQQATFNDMTQNYGMSPAQALSAMGQSGATTVAEATGASSGGSTATSTPSTSSTASSGGGSSSGGSSAPDYTSMVNSAYTDYLGRAADQGGVDYWVGQLNSGAVSPDDFKEEFVGAALYNAESMGAANPESAAKIIETAQTIPALQNTINVSAINSATQLRADTGQFASQTTGANQLANIYQTELGRAADAGGLDFYNGRLNQLYNLGFTQEQALAQVRAEMDQSPEGATYDTNTPSDQNKGLDGSLGSYEQSLINADIQGFDIGNPVSMSQLQTFQDELEQKGINPITGQQTGTTGTTGTTGVAGTGGSTGIPATDYYGTVAQTGGLIGSQPSGMLTPFQQASLAQNQALLGTMQAAAGPRGSLATTNYAPYVNPYTSGVINATMADLERQRQMQQNQIGYQATQAGAFGGSRHGVAEALTNEAMQRTMANTAAQQRQAAFQQAQGAAQFDIGSELAQRQQGLAAAQQMSGLGQTSFGYGTDINAMLSGVGAQQQALQQAQIDAAKGQYAGYQAYPVTGAGTFANILNATPHGSTQTYNPGVMDYLTLAASAAPFIPTSDIRLKKNIKKVGELANGLGVYTWEWKDKIKDLVGNFSMTKGVMAQEAMEVIPEAVKTMPNGYLAVDYSHPELSGVA